MLSKVAQDLELDPNDFFSDLKNVFKVYKMIVFVIYGMVISY